MSLSKSTKTISYITLGLLVVTLLLMVFNYWSKGGKQKTTKNDVMSVTYDTEPVNRLPKKWKYTLDDKPQYAFCSYNDSSWQTINPKLKIDSVNPDMLKSIIWFRCWFKLSDTLKGKSLAFLVNHYGASEIYLDGVLIHKYGKVSAYEAQEYCRIPDMPVFFSLSDTNKHLLAVRYSNHKAIKFYEKYEEDAAGINVKLFPNIKSAIENYRGGSETIIIIMLLVGFFITLSIVHLLLYIFYRKQKENLYYSLFVFIYALVMFKPVLSTLIHYSSAYLFYEYHSLLPPIFMFPALVGCLFSLFKPKHKKVTFVIGSIVTFFTIASCYMSSLADYNGIAFFILVLFTCVESVRAIVTGFIRRQEGVRIIGTGVLVFLITLIAAIVTAFATQSNISVQVNGIEGIIFLLLGMLALVSIPLSMSIYLARNFALTNKHLTDKLIEVEQLSEKSLQQEKEKQQILATQNEMLEQKVTERTTEVIEQKRIVEEKQKEIIDSITYAKRLQQAILPPQKFIDEHFPNNFVLYKPKDIVAGDFYWGESVNNLFFLAAADSTGHGVPGAMVSVVCSNALNRAVKEFDVTDTGKILDKTRDLVIETFEKSNAEVKDGMDISLLCIDKQYKKVYWSGANNPLWYIQNNELKEIKADKQPIGRAYHATPFTTHQIEYTEGTIFYLFTDGFADQFGGPNGKKFKYKQMELLLVSINDKPMPEQLKIINQKFDEWKDKLDQVDDVCVIGLKI